MPSSSTAISASPSTPPDAGLREILKRYSLPTYDAARAFRRTRHARYLPSIVRGVLEQQVAADLLPKLDLPAEQLRLVEDLGLDSLALIETASALEDAVGFRIADEELRQLATAADIERVLAVKSRA